MPLTAINQPFTRVLNMSRQIANHVAIIQVVKYMSRQEDL